MLKPGDPAPIFDLPCAIGDRIDRISLAKLDSEVVVLFFYPRDFSFICPTEVTGFQTALDDFRKENTALMAASVDDAETHRRWARELGGIGYPLLADEGGKVARAYGVFDEPAGVALRATFVIDRGRTVRFAVACPLNVGRSVSETLRVVRAIRTGQLCPADWTPGVEFGPSDRKY
jgi:peroxiredoxin (alkyl hydroperoxide reductase subunit C)